MMGVSFDFADAAGRADAIAVLYVGYFDRAPDPTGLGFWVEELENAIAAGRPGAEVLVDIANSFAPQDEARAEYALLASPQIADDAARRDFVSSVYANLFNRAPDQDGLEFWVGQLAMGKPVGRVILDIVSGAQGDDAVTVDNKVGVALHYADLFGNGRWSVLDDRSSAVTVIDAVDATDDSVTAGMAAAEAAFAADLATTSAVKVTFDDPEDVLAPLQADIEAVMDAAWRRWEDVLDLAHKVTIDVEIATRSDTLALAFGESPDSVALSVLPGFGEVVQTALAYELITGSDPEPLRPDVRIWLVTDNLDEIAFDPSGDTGPSEYNGLDLLTHELGHALGFKGFYDDPTLATVFETWVDRDTGAFIGPHALAQMSGGIPLSSSLWHLDPSVFDGAVMEPAMGRGEHKIITPAEIAILGDIGLPVDPMLVA